LVIITSLVTDPMSTGASILNYMNVEYLIACIKCNHLMPPPPLQYRLSMSMLGRISRYKGERI
jgi:hypothetical protein